MALITSVFFKPSSLLFSPRQRVTTRTRPFACKVQNSGFNQAQRKQSPLHSSFVTQSALANGVSVVAKEADQEGKPQCRILLSDIVVQNRREVFWRTNWNALDIASAGIVLATHLLGLCAPFYFTWNAFWVAAGLYLVSGLGITLSFHRNLSHRSFKLPKWLEYLFAYCGVQALQGNPIDWVSTHRYHHQFCDSERDPHSPIEGFWFSHMNWLFDSKTVAEKRGESSNVGDLEKQPFYRFLQTTYLLHPIAFGVLLYALGGFPFLVWGMGVRIVWVYHITWLVNSASHVWGKQAWNTGGWHCLRLEKVGTTTTMLSSTRPDTV
ncbi:palmitoyl-monogalactosyldiacylglycerol delta-7 desaturase, chloroplastic-like isoform X2 [Hibiscus syriacus]|uniref:palmitoyl-monogalactosyldiacylglycerol delta-7 desaturase, chloroplastic-like isoform X2 n=1 Tax=Hibiscus syriacus TaxID=106335 RepID=UPI0019227EF8|nr:palmitoyl-monogalactosyldiacylglycerol delta-7 desaturase, chloroplastic-like isoform X2 [Hibiscus syriacus]